MRRMMWAYLGLALGLLVVAPVSNAATRQYVLELCSRATGKCRTIYYQQHGACMIDLASERNVHKNQIGLHPCKEVAR